MRDYFIDFFFFLSYGSYSTLGCQEKKKRKEILLIHKSPAFKIVSILLNTYTKNIISKQKNRDHPRLKEQSNQMFLTFFSLTSYGIPEYYQPKFRIECA